jgi:hypothetical protein
MDHSSFDTCDDCLSMKIACLGQEFFEALEATSILHILVLVYLRLLAMRQPLATENLVIQLRKKLIILIWTISFAVEILALIGHYFDNFWVHWTADVFVLFCLEVAPLISIIVINCLVVKTMEQKRREMMSSDLMTSNKSFFISNYDSTALLHKRLVGFLLISLTPYLFCRLIHFIGTAVCGDTICDVKNPKVIQFIKF